MICITNKMLVFALNMMLCFSLADAQLKDYAALVNPFIGTGGHGHTYPGATWPFGAVQLSPDTRLEGWDGCSGYHYSDSVIYGFSHTHLSGTGCSDYGDVLLMPVVATDKALLYSNKIYSSHFSHKNESASPGYYKVKLDKHQIEAELTTTLRTGWHRYKFPATKNAAVVLDLAHRDEVIDSYIKIVDNQTLTGLRRSRAWAKDQWVYFCIKFSKPFTQSGIFENDLSKNSKQASGKNIKSWFGFDVTDNKPLMIKVALSAVSEEGAIKNLAAESPGWDFEKTKQNARQAWNNELKKIDVEGSTKERQTIFYTALYHCMLNPNVYMDVDGSFRSTDNQVHNLKEEIKNGSAPIGRTDKSMSGQKVPIDTFTNYTVFSLWDTYRALHPLLSIIDRKRTTDFINTFMAQYHYGNILPVWELSGNETWCMIGYHSVPVIADAMVKGIGGFDSEMAYKAMKHSADTNLFGLDCYKKSGFVSNECDHESVSKTLEYAYDDWCIAQCARIEGNKPDYERFIKRSQNYKNIFDGVSGFMRGRNNGLFHHPFSPAEVNNYYTEANAWQYSFYVPHDVSGLMKLHGGQKQFNMKLQQLFTSESTIEGRQQADITGLIGQYAHGNEPSHHIAYLFNYSGLPWLSQSFAKYICDSMYFNKPDGLSGNEDCGQMSAWYVFSAMGFYPVCPGRLQYALGSPLFDKVTINLENGKQFVITSSGRTAEKFCVKSSTLNEKPYNRFYIDHNEIMNGGHFAIDMCSLAEVDTYIDESVLPVSSVDEFPIVAVPGLYAPSRAFRNKMSVAMKSATRQDVYYFFEGDNQNNARLYQAPVEITDSKKLFCFSKNEQAQSGIVSAEFKLIPEKRNINLLANFDNQYTAGGNDALIDGIRGDMQWRKGGWQGYWGENIEAIIDLGDITTVTKLGLNCYQETGPWIFFPSLIEFYTGNDSLKLEKAASIKPPLADQNTTPEIKSFVADVNKKCRYIKIVAHNFGKVPAWHISAGENAWLFADEIIIE